VDWALGLNEFGGYLAVGLTAWITGYMASLYALRPQPFYLGIGVAFTGLLLSLFAKETRQYATLAAKLHQASVAASPLTVNFAWRKFHCRESAAFKTFS
jgi:hypothetical protein